MGRSIVVAAVNGNLLNWVVTILLGIMSFLGANLWYDQRAIAKALAENTLAIGVLTQRFSSYIDVNDQRFEDASKNRERIEMRLNAIENRK